ncbi:hypothetical protein DMP15_29930 [Pseudonocardia sp. UM4_GMWB1]
MLTVRRNDSPGRTVVGAWVMSSDGLRSASATSPNAVDTQRGALLEAVVGGEPAAGAVDGEDVERRRRTLLLPVARVGLVPRAAGTLVGRAATGPGPGAVTGPVTGAR